MENNLINKSCFFALYWGQEVFGSPFLQGSWDYTGENFDEIDEEVWMNLKNLSSITDEDANYCRSLIERKYLKEINSIESWLMDTAYKTNYSWNFLNVCDYLRSKSYALPYMGLSVEKQIEYGWIKLVK